MRLWRFATRALGVLAVLGAGGALVYLGANAWVKRRAIAEAERRGVVLEVDGARIGVFSAELRGARARLEGVPGLAVTIARIAVELEGSGRPARVRAEGGQVRTEGDPAALVDAVRAWRARRGPASPSQEGAVASAGPTLEAVGFDVVVPLPDGARATLRDAALTKDGDEWTATLADARVERADGKVTGELVKVVVSGRKLRLLSAASAAVEVSLPAPPPAAEASAAGAAIEPAAAVPILPPPVVKRRAGRRDIPPAEPLKVPLPDVAPARAVAEALGRRVAELLTDGADLRVERLSLAVSRGADKLTLGPGPLAVTRAANHVEVEYSTDPKAPGTPLAIKVGLPAASQELRASLSGGPLSLAALGVKEGAFGLLDVARSEVSGRASFKIDTAGAATFDADVRVARFGLARPWLAREPAHGLDIGVRVAGAYESRKRLRIDDAELALGALRGHLRGSIESVGDAAKLTASFDVPTASCQALLDSVPDALMPTVKGAKLAGTFGAVGQLSFDATDLDELGLAYRFDDRCRFVEVPKSLDRERFRKPFVHVILKPDGKEGELTTGPDTPAWTPIELISPYMMAAVLTTEDGAFYKHHGFNHAAIRASLVANMKARRFVRGASTITMQLAKNLFLSRQKTLGRKLEELVLADYLEQTFSKDELMELYLNVIEFGPNVYGIGAAAEHYYGRKAEELNVVESLFLASLLPKPLEAHKMYERGAVGDGWQRHLRSLVDIAFRTGKISEAERNEAATQTVAFFKEGMPRPPPRSAVHGGLRGGDEEWKVVE